MRDLDQWKDKVEITLDGRQLFFLFFGGAVITSMMFFLGVMTGRRLEARSLALQPPSIDDPLAALDQLGDVEEEGLTFHHSLTHGAKQKPGAASSHSSASSPTSSPSAAPSPSPVSASAASVASSPSAAPAASAPSPAASPSAKPAPAPSPGAKPASPSPAVASAKPTAPATPPPSVPGHFTLQLSAFADKADADAFVKRMQGSGYKPFVVASEIPGKGVFYRVRLGDYTNRESATAAKEELEKKQSVVAYVTKL